MLPDLLVLQALQDSVENVNVTLEGSRIDGFKKNLCYFPLRPSVPPSKAFMALFLKMIFPPKPTLYAHGSINVNLNKVHTMTET